MSTLTELWRSVSGVLREGGVLLLLTAMLLCQAPVAFAQSATEAAAPAGGASDFWRQIKSGSPGYSAVPGRESGVAINIYGQNWRLARVRILRPWGAVLMGGALLLIATFFAFRGPVKLPADGERSTVARHTPYQRIAHWFLVILFLLLALTGLVLLYGRPALEPLFGPGAFAAMASAAKEAHNLFGPIFLFALVLLIPGYLRDNLPRRDDLGWLAAGGGYFGRHASAGRFNPGEKLWFWLVCGLGLGLSATGLILDFTLFGFTRPTVELAHFLHVNFAFVLIAVALGHIYLGTVGIPGTLRGMVRGTVERRWAAMHHDRWLRRVDEEPGDGRDRDRA